MNREKISRRVRAIKVGTLCAGDDELAPFLLQITECKVSERAMLKFYEGKYAIWLWLFWIQLYGLESACTILNASQRKTGIWYFG